MANRVDRTSQADATLTFMSALRTIERTYPPISGCRSHSSPRTGGLSIRSSVGCRSGRVRLRADTATELPVCQERARADRLELSPTQRVHSVPLGSPCRRPLIPHAEVAAGGATHEWGGDAGQLSSGASVRLWPLPLPYQAGLRSVSGLCHSHISSHDGAEADTGPRL